MNDILEQLKRAQERDAAEMRQIERLSAAGINPNEACAKVVCGDFRLSESVMDALAVV